jgi:hypothetical protein
MLGSFISGILIPYKSFAISRKYGTVFLLISALLCVSAWVDIYYKEDFVLYDLMVAMAAGMQVI